MALTPKEKTKIMEKVRAHDKDTGSSEVQVALLTEEINHLTLHLKKNLKEYFANLKAKFEALAKDPYEKYALDYFDFISWTESKIENKPFAQVIREKNLKS